MSKHSQIDGRGLLSHGRAKSDIHGPTVEKESFTMSLLQAFQGRAAHAWALVRGSRLRKIGSLVVAGAGLYDLTISQLLAKNVAEEMPKLREILIFLHFGLPLTAWVAIISLILVGVLFEDSFQRANPKSNVKAAILRLNYSANREAFDIVGSVNIESAERRMGGAWDVQFKQRVDHHTLTARVPDGEDVRVFLTDAGPRRARLDFLEAPLSHILRDNPLDIIFECAEV
jgi:hypothetical protein